MPRPHLPDDWREQADARAPRGIQRQWHLRHDWRCDFLFFSGFAVGGRQRCNRERSNQEKDKDEKDETPYVELENAIVVVE